MSTGDELTQLGAAAIARGVAGGELSAREVCDAFVARIEAVGAMPGGRLNAIVAPLFDSARREADAVDAARQRGEPLGPLGGVPLTVKDCFDVAGTASTMGLTSLRDKLATHDSALVERLRRAGGVILGKTNVPQLMLWHECDNPLFGRTNNPWNTARSPGGSSGGEAAMIAAHASALGLGSDLGGSIRVPCHVCGIHGLKPTSGRLTRTGTVENLRGMQAILFQPGPMARHVEDLSLAMRVLGGSGPAKAVHDEAPVTLGDPGAVELDKLRVAVWADDGYFRACPAVRRAVREAADALRACGAEVEEIDPPDAALAMELFAAIVSSDGGSDGRRLVRGSEVDRRLGQLLFLSSLSRPVRWAMATALDLAGERRQARLLRESRRRSAEAYWQVTHRLRRFTGEFMQRLAEGRFDAIISPPYALPAVLHNTAHELIPAASYCILFNVLGLPSGVVAAGRVQPGEESDRTEGGDRCERLSRRIESDSAGLPVGVHVAAAPWREDIVLAVMGALEEAFRRNDDYPAEPPYPTIKEATQSTA